MTLTFRNINVSPDDPVELWPTEAILTALERGGLSHWRRLATAIHDDPWGPVARRVEEALSVAQAYGVDALMTNAIAVARAEAAVEERRLVAAEIAGLLSASGMSRPDFAARIGTSASRLSTYLSGKVTPSATLLLRMRRVASAQSRHAGQGAPSPS